MQCRICKNNNAILHIRQIIGEEITDIHLCQKCAAKNGIVDNKKPSELSIAGIIGNLVSDSGSPAILPEIECGNCGAKLKDFTDSNLVGCAECYAAFNEHIIGSMESRGVLPVHQGSFPAHLKEVKNILVDKELLKSKLKTAVADENYEEAAQIRDEMKEIDSREGDVCG